MKKTISIIVLCCLMAACASEKRANADDPIENLISFLDSKKYDLHHKKKQYEGGSVLKTKVEYFCLALKPDALEPEELKGLTKEQLEDLKEEEEIVDSCLRAFRWGCSFAHQCYHKEKHVLDKDTVLYALALDGLDGERIELTGINSYEDYSVGYKAARAATLRVKADKRRAELGVEYIIREEKGKEMPFNDRALKDFIKRITAEIDSVKVYEVSYEYTREDFQGNPTLMAGIYDENGSLDGKASGHLYVVPESHAKEVFEALKIIVVNDYVGLNPNQKFFITIDGDKVSVGEGIESDKCSSTQANHHKGIMGKLSLDGHFYMLVIDQFIGAYAEPIHWHHILSIKDHKVEYIPGAHQPNKDGWID
ncbi:MAG: hypothetical protein IJ142_10440 [Bacteroidaceae bacterium]|nr:hypothetical protein [Bacteroidaceae bacterium]MBQ9191994.1 hypothetical protein [Bacteroidaceae bacterium]